MTVVIKDGFKESGNYMNEKHLQYFKEKLTIQQNDLKARMAQCFEKIKNLKHFQADILDRSNTTMDFEAALSTYRRYHQLHREIDQALKRIANRTYGYCCITGEEIGLRRLDILPCTTVSIQALEQIQADDA